MKTILIIFSFSLTPLLMPAQTIQYFNEEGVEVDSANSFYYVEYKKEQPDISYYTKNKAIRFQELQLEGDRFSRTYFYQSGKMKATGTFVRGQLDGLTKSYYESGIPKAEIINARRADDGENSTPPIRVINYWDSAGVKLIENGAGVCACDLDPIEESSVIEKGKIENELKQGEWIAKTEIFSYSEVYDRGLLQRGTQIYKGEQFKYTQLEETAKPNGGFVAFYKHVAQVVRYPTKARRHGVEGKVFVQFVVEKDGRFSNLRVIKGIGDGCDEQALEAVKSSPKWIPGKQRGRPVKQRYTLPIQFKLG